MVVREDFSTIIRKIRIFSGAILFAYVIMHLLNHSINVFSIDLADAVRSSYFIRFGKTLWVLFFSMGLLLPT